MLQNTRLRCALGTLGEGCITLKGGSLYHPEGRFSFAFVFSLPLIVVVYFLSPKMQQRAIISPVSSFLPAFEAFAICHVAFVSDRFSYACTPATHLSF